VLAASAERKAKAPFGSSLAAAASARRPDRDSSPHKHDDEEGGGRDNKGTRKRERENRTEHGLYGREKGMRQ